MPEAGFTSSVPGIYSGLLKLVREAAASQAPEIPVFPYELAQNEPERYVVVGGIEGPTYEWEAVPLQLREVYDIAGKVIVYKGETPSAEQASTFAEEAVTEVYAIFNACVMGPALAGRGAPTFGTAGPSAQITFPIRAEHKSGVAVIGGQQGGWMSEIDWALHFEAIISPTPALP